MSTTTTRAPARNRALLAKVPEVTAIFWVVKLLTTAVGEVASDWMVNHSWLLVGAAGGGSMLAALIWQLRADRYSAVRYWTLAATIATFGTAAEDFLVHLGGTHNQGTVLYASLLAAVLFAWWRTEGTLSFHAIDTTRRELFYWATVLATFALGTAAGDVTSGIWGWGFLNSIWLFAALMVVPLVLWRLGGNVIACFWAAYILTRPLGASVSDYLAKPWLGGADLGVPEVTTVGAVLLVAVVTWLSLTKRDIQPARPHR